MAARFKKATSGKTVARHRRHRRIRGRILGLPERPRLAVFRSEKHIYAQIINDHERCVLAAASTRSRGLKIKKGSNISAAAKIGEEIAKRAQEKKIKKVVFDAAGYKYHGRVKALDEAARQGGLVF
ncbi:MAG: 50S ribosomal protein L18 [Deltaproteobacteria bacterium]